MPALSFNPYKKEYSITWRWSQCFFMNIDEYFIRNFLIGDLDYKLSGRSVNHGPILIHFLFLRNVG